MGIYGTFSARSLEVQTTDIETKFHLKRRIVSCIQRRPDGTYKKSNQFELKDTCCLREDIDALIHDEIQKKQEASNLNGLPLPCQYLATKEEIYNSIKLTQENKELLFKKIANENPDLRNQRIKEDTDRYQTLLKQQFPLNKISRKQTVVMLHALEEPIYQLLKIAQPIKKSYVTYDRKVRREQNKTKK